MARILGHLLLFQRWKAVLRSGDSSCRIKLLEVATFTHTSSAYDGNQAAEGRRSVAASGGCA